MGDVNWGPHWTRTRGSLEYLAGGRGSVRAELPHACGGHDGAALFDWIWSYFKSLAAPRIPTATGVESSALSVLNCRVH